MGLGEKRRSRPGRHNRGGRRNIGGRRRNVGGHRHRSWGHRSWSHGYAGRAARFGTLRGSVSMMTTGAIFAIFALIYITTFHGFWAFSLFGVATFFFVFGSMSFVVYKQGGVQTTMGSSVSVISVAPSHMSTTQSTTLTTTHHQEYSHTSTTSHLQQGYSNGGMIGGNHSGQFYPPPPNGGQTFAPDPYNQPTNPAYPQMFRPPGGAQNCTPGPATTPSAPWPAQTTTSSTSYDPTPPGFNQQPPPMADEPGAPPPSYDSVVAGTHGSKPQTFY